MSSEHHHHMHHTEHEPSPSFSRETDGLPTATTSQAVILNPSETFELRAEPVRKHLGETTVKMLAYNQSIPGPTLIARQGSEATIQFKNLLDLETTAHWHGLRLDNRFDGVPAGAHHGMMPPLSPGDSFTYQLQFPDPGIYWYHPHLREDYTQELGLYGAILVTPNAEDYWSPVNQEHVLMLDDILLQDGQIAPFNQSHSDHTAMGRFGNVMLVNGEISPTLTARQSEVLRLFLVNTANVRSFNVHLPGARMKLVGRDSGRVEHEEFITDVLLSPSERVIVEVLFEQAGQFSLEHHTPHKVYQLATVNVQQQPTEHSFVETFSLLRQDNELVELRKKIAQDFDRPADRILNLMAEMPGMSHMHESGHDMAAMEHHGMAHPVERIEWEDTMPEMNQMSTPQNMFWKLVDPATGAINHGIDWQFSVGDQIKIRIVNDATSDHPMQHPIHFHGQRFLVLNRDGQANGNLAWKDTVLVEAGEVVEILLDASNPGDWMVHCHIAEHLEGGMMFTYHVQ